MDCFAIIPQQYNVSALYYSHGERKFFIKSLNYI